MTSYAALINAQAKEHKKQPSLIGNANHHSKQASVCSGAETKTLTKQSHSHAALPKGKRLRERRQPYCDVDFSEAREDLNPLAVSLKVSASTRVRK